jgi:hypothetical protein
LTMTECTPRSHASIAEAARIEDFYGSGDENKRHSALAGRM